MTVFEVQSKPTTWYVLFLETVTLRWYALSKTDMCTYFASTIFFHSGTFLLLAKCNDSSWLMNQVGGHNATSLQNFTLLSINSPYSYILNEWIYLTFYLTVIKFYSTAIKFHPNVINLWWDYCKCYTLYCRSRRARVQAPWKALPLWRADCVKNRVEVDVDFSGRR